MKKLNKKGFTLVELLAVIVILALLIVVVANTALPAMNNAKKNTLDTYTKRVVEQAKTMYISDNALCAASASACNLVTLMGVDAPKDQYEAGLYTTYSATGGYAVNGWVIDKKNENIRKVTNGQTAEGACTDIKGGTHASTACPEIATCKWDATNGCVNK